MKNLSFRQIATLVVFFVTLGGFTILNFIIPAPDRIAGERRPAEPIPDTSVSNIVDGSWTQSFNDYAADNFVFREQLRTVRAFMTFHVFRQSDSDGLFLHNGHIGRFMTMSEAQYYSTGLQLRSIFDFLNDDSDRNFFFAVIPCKSWYTPYRHMGINANRAMEMMREAMPDVTHIDISNSLTLEDFYRTDWHWDQTRLWGVMDTLARYMNFTVPEQPPIHDFGSWRGGYYGQLALPMRSDRMRVHAMPEHISAHFMTNQGIRRGPIYWENRFHVTDDYGNRIRMHEDPYDIFLRGVEPVVWLRTGANTGRNLYVFRDSFGSSIAPLLALTEYYDEVILIDLRLTRGGFLSDPDMFTFSENADILFLYSTQIMNSAELFSGIE